MRHSPVLKAERCRSNLSMIRNILVDSIEKNQIHIINH